MDNDWFAARAAERAGRRAELRRAFGLPEDAVVFLFAGKLVGKKRPQDLIAALGRLPPESKSRACALVAGDGPLRGACEQMALEQDAATVFAGFLNQSRLPDAYAAADVLVLPSDAGETWGLVVNEAMASGRPAIASRAAGCCADLVTEGKTGCSFAPGHIDSLAGILAGYLREPDRAGREGRGAAKHIQAFGLDPAADGIAAAVGICGGKKVGSC